jgi:hypothetical protein
VGWSENDRRWCYGGGWGDGWWWVGVGEWIWRVRDGKGVFGKKGNGGGREVGGGWFGRRMTGDGVSVVGEVDAGGGWRWVCVFGCLGG